MQADQRNEVRLPAIYLNAGSLPLTMMDLVRYPEGFLWVILFSLPNELTIHPTNRPTS